MTHLVKQATKPGSANLEIAKQIFPNYDKNEDDFITFEEFIQPEHDELWDVHLFCFPLFLFLDIIRDESVCVNPNNIQSDRVKNPFQNLQFFETF